MLQACKPDVDIYVLRAAPTPLASEVGETSWLRVCEGGGLGEEVVKILAEVAKLEAMNIH